MRRTHERIYQIGDVRQIERTITDDTPAYAKVAVWFACLELGGTLAIMLGIVALAIAKRHGWIA